MSEEISNEEKKSEKAEPERIGVFCRFTREELDMMRAATGAISDCNAASCFVRLNLRKGAR